MLSGGYVHIGRARVSLKLPVDPEVLIISLGFIHHSLPWLLIS